MTPRALLALCWLIAVQTIGAEKDIHEAVRLDCKQEGKIMSAKDETPARWIEFRNYTDEAIYAQWLGWEGERDPDMVSKIEPGESAGWSTYVDHPWIILDSNKKCLFIVNPKREIEKVTVRTPNEDD